MYKYGRFEDLPVWQEAARLYNVVLDLLEEANCPLTWGFRNQLDRAALSVSNNIAEGFERSSTKELVGYLGIVRGSAGEVRSMIAAVRNRRRLIELKQHFGVIDQADYGLDHFNRELASQREAVPCPSRNARLARRSAKTEAPRVTLRLRPHRRLAICYWL